MQLNTGHLAQHFSASWPGLERVELDLSRLEDTTERLNITLSRRVLTLIDEAAKRASESRSGFLARAGIEAAQHVGWHTG